MLLTTSCPHDKLGSIDVVTGPDVARGVGLKKHRLPPPAEYAALLDRLRGQAAARGANAMLLRWHQAVFLTKDGVEAGPPVRVAVKAAAIRLHDPGKCAVEPVSEAELERRAHEGEVEHIEIEYDAMSRPLKHRPQGLRSRVISSP